MASPQDFLAEAYSYARQAGLSDHAARLAVAQSALETGYGKSVVGNNYHGIKAGRNYSGPTQRFKTWEDVNGKRVNIVDRFRVYQSPIQSFLDWKKTVSSKWPEVFTAKTFKEAVSALKPGQKGGYATDRHYASKINSINGKISRSVGGSLPDAPPLPPQRFQTIASRAVAPTPQSIRTAATLGALPAGGSTRLPDKAYAAPVAPVTRSPLTAIASALNPVSSAQAAPMPNRPSIGAVMGQGQMTPPSFASARMMAPAPSVPTQRFSNAVPASPPSTLSPQQVSAYRDYANTRAYAPVDPVPSRAPSVPSGFLTSTQPMGQPQPLQQQTAQPAFVPTQQPVNPVAPVPPTVPQYIAKPVQQRIDEAFAPSSMPPAPTMPSAMDVYSGQANRGMASDGSTVSRDEYGRTAVTNKYGATTVSLPNGSQAFSGISGPIGQPGIRTPSAPVRDMPSVPQRPSQFGSMVRGGIGSVVGGGLGGMLAGPIGAALGAVVAGDLARGRNPIDRLGIGTFTVPVTDQFGFTQPMKFANPKSGGAFPDAPRNPSGGLGGKDSNRSERSMREISPAAARDIKSGKTGLF